ncbi:PH domain-containing protein [Nocardia amikacinitolerans]|uniref:PH domain-containing protein n=1 Tax=Nocardia amikacinitolerans TaxID=756689 RepID=UPI0027E37439|nr:PH domain-containing protein [Nocardia amikacinitolerans]MCP2290215.1 putative membrane protein [Nocardia amikacinitolerans]
MTEQPPVGTGPPWSRLDKRMLLVHPVTEVVKFIPVLIGSVILGTSSGNPAWSIIPLVLIVGFALTRWFTTTYRVGPTHVELRTGLVQRRELSVPRSRIRSVDIESDLLHRALGLSVVVIGTGQQADSGEKFKLDSLDARVVPALRTELLAHTARPAPATPAAGVSEDTAAQALPTAREIGHWRPEWVRYAPLSLTGFAVIAPIVGAAFQYGLGEVVFESDAAQDLGEGTAAAIVLVVLGLFAAIVLVVSLAACTRYLTTYFGLRVLHNGHTLHLRHGLFTTRQITLDLARFRGATVNEPLLLRLSGAAELEAIMVGENPRQKILPQAPRAAIERTLGELLAPGATAAPAGEPLAPLSARLTRHGPAARRRRYFRALSPVVLLTFAVLAFALEGPIPPWWWLVPGVTAIVAIALAEDRYRGLGHTVLPRTSTSPAWLITRSGCLDRDRDCLEAPGVIGWTVRQSFWQRRAGLATVIAATAAGKKRYLVIDVPLDQAWPLVESVTPGALGSH